MTRPVVSVVIPTYNRADLLPRALDSVVGQTFSDWEIVLVSDGSTDETDRVAVRYEKRLGRRLVYLEGPHQGSSSARNRGIEACRGRFVAFLDDDDEYLPAKLERQLHLFAARSELGFVYSDYGFVDLDGTEHPSMFATKARLARLVPFERIAPGLCVCTGDLFDMLIQGYFLATIVGMVRREVLGEKIRFPTTCAYAEEWLFYLRVARACPAGFVDEPLCRHHHTLGSLARTDKHRNTVRYRHVLRAIDAAFDDLTRRQRSTLRRHLAHTCRQLGYNARRAGKYHEALRHFAESFRYGPRFRPLRETAQTAFVGALHAIFNPSRARAADHLEKIESRGCWSAQRTLRTAQDTRFETGT